MLKKSMILILFLSMTQAWCYNQGLGRLFSKRFFKDYKPSECILNIEDFIKEANALKINISNTRILSITNNGNANFGQVNALFARSTGKKNPKFPSSGLKRLPGEKNWKFHVVLEDDGDIYDFDFGNEPRVLGINEYFEKMFLDNRQLNDEKRKTNYRELKLKEYLISTFKNSDNLVNLDLKDNKKINQIILKDFLVK